MITHFRQAIEETLPWLSSFGADPAGGMTRLLYSPEWLETQQQFKKRMAASGLETRFDEVGNLYGRLNGTEYPQEVVLSGSHIDTVVNGGNLDGQFGALAAWLAIDWLKTQYGAPLRTVEVVAMAEEEGSRFPYVFWGSKNIFGLANPDDVRNICDAKGNSFVDAMKACGFTLPNAPLTPRQDIKAFVELHIEQAAVLDRLKLPIGVVEGICGASYINVTVKGVQEHAGSTPMDIRKDPMCAASEIILETEKAANEISSINAVATVGKLNVFPNAANVIPGQVDFVIDIRDVDMTSKDGVIKRIISFMEKVASERGVKIEYTVTGNDVPRMSDKRIVKILEEHCKEMKLPYKKMVSGAYHDSLLVAEFAPMAMIFVPSKDGISHHKAEFTEMADIACGAELLANTLFDLANMEV